MRSNELIPEVATEIAVKTGGPRRYVNSCLFVVLILFGVVWWQSLDKIKTARVDFVSFYTVAKMLIAGEAAHLYDIQKQTQVQQPLMNGYVFQGGALLFVHPPFQSILFLPLGFLPFAVAYGIWVIFMTWLGWLSVSLLLKFTDYPRLLAWSSQIHVAAFCFLPVWISLVQGQDSLMLLFFMTWTFVLLKQDKETYAGAVLACSLFKFHLVLPLYFVILVKAKWRVLKGSAYSVLLLLAVSFVTVGLRGISDYFRLMLEMVTWVNKFNFTPSQMRNMRGMIALVLGEHRGLVALASLVLTSCVLVVLMIVWRGDWNPQNQKFDLQFSSALIAGLLIGHYLYSHDQSILVLPFFILLGITQSVTGTIRAVFIVLMALANPAIGLSIVNVSQLRIPVNALYLLILFGSVAYLASGFADLVSPAFARLKEHGAPVSVTET